MHKTQQKMQDFLSRPYGNFSFTIYFLNYTCRETIDIVNEVIRADIILRAISILNPQVIIF